MWAQYLNLSPCARWLEMGDWFRDVASGGAMPLLYALYSTPLGLPMVASTIVLGSVLPLLVRWEGAPQILRGNCPTDHILGLAVVSFTILLNVSTLLSKADRLDADVGSILCLAPLFTLLTIPGTAPAMYLSILRRTTSYTVAMWACVGVWVLWQGVEVPQPVPDQVYPVVSLVHIVLGTWCSCQSERREQIVFSLRNVLYLVLASSKVLLSVLLTGSGSLLLWVIHGLLLLQSCISLARSSRRYIGGLNVKDPSRTTALLSALLVTFGYALRIHVARWAPWMGVCLMGLKTIQVTLGVPLDDG